jgi:hypothetical protein
MTPLQRAEERKRNAEWDAYLRMTPEQRATVEAGLASLRYLLDRLPRSYRGPMATAEDCASFASVDAFLERNGITPAKGETPP